MQLSVHAAFAVALAIAGRMWLMNGPAGTIFLIGPGVTVAAR